MSILTNRYLDVTQSTWHSTDLQGLLRLGAVEAHGLGETSASAAEKNETIKKWRNPLRPTRRNSWNPNSPATAANLPGNQKTSSNHGHMFNKFSISVYQWKFKKTIPICANLQMDTLNSSVVVTLCLALAHRACHIHGIWTRPASQVGIEQTLHSLSDLLHFITCL